MCTVEIALASVCRNASILPRCFYSAEMLLFCRDASVQLRCCCSVLHHTLITIASIPTTVAAPLVLIQHSSRSAAPPTIRLLSGINSVATRVHMDVQTMEVDKVTCRESTATGKVVLGLAANSNRVNLELEGKVVFEDVAIDELLSLLPPLYVSLDFVAMQCVSISAFKEFIHTAATRFLLIALLAGVGIGINTYTLQSWASEDLHNVEVQRLRNVAISLEVCLNRPRSWNKYVKMLISSASTFWRFVSWPAPLSFDADAAESNTYQSTSALSWAAIASLLLCNSISGLAYDTKGWIDGKLEATWEVIAESSPDPLSFNLEDKNFLKRRAMLRAFVFSLFSFFLGSVFFIPSIRITVC